MKVRTRFAPSPTGALHLGNARTAVLNWLVARHHGGSFILRFEDTDPDRQVASAERHILDALDWLELDRDEDPVAGGPHAPYRQSERAPLYRDRAEWLLACGSAFRCWCTPEELESRRRRALAEGGSPGYDGRCRELTVREEAAFRAEGRHPAVRFRVDPGPITFRDRTAGEVTIHGADFGDLVILRSDGRPTYNYAAVVDDIAMEITHVIRGAGHLSNTPKQVLLFRAFGADLPEFVHIPTVLAPGGGKLSKRAGARGVLEYREEGYHPHGVVNYLSLLSWSDVEGEEVLGRDELVERIDLDRLGGPEPVLDPEKMRWMSGQHVRRESPAGLARRLAPFVDRQRLELDDRDLLALAEVVRERIHLLSDAEEEAERLFAPPEPSGEEAARALRGPDAARALEAAERVWSTLPEWSRASLREAIRELPADTGLKGGALFRPLRAALTGVLKGPELPDVAYALGRERCLARLRTARAALVSGDAAPGRGATRAAPDDPPDPGG